MTDLSLSGGRPRRSDNVVVGYFDARHDIIVYREEEVGIAWVAEADGMGRAALGGTPEEACRNLLRVLTERGHGHVDPQIALDWKDED